jgi:hypothetical protein
MVKNESNHENRFENVKKAKLYVTSMIEIASNNMLISQWPPPNVFYQIL